MIIVLFEVEWKDTLLIYNTKQILKDRNCAVIVHFKKSLDLGKTLVYRKAVDLTINPN